MKKKKGMLFHLTGHNRWKSLYFVLVSAQKLIYFFEGEESTKPKGAINIRNSVFHTVDESIFKKKYW